MKILVTGYKGFIGQNMVQSLRDDGHEVDGFTWGEELPPLSDYRQVIHLGAISSTATSDVNLITTKNYEFTIKLLDRCNEKGVDVQYASSASVYGQLCDFRENSADPKTPYAWTKYMIDRYVATRPWRINVQGFRYFNVYGPHEDHKDQPSPFSLFTRQATTTGVIKLFEGEPQRDFVSVERVIEIHKKFFGISETGVWNIGSGTARTFSSIAEEIAEKYQAKIERIPMPANLGYQWYTKADLTKLYKTLSGAWR